MSSLLAARREQRGILAESSRPVGIGEERQAQTALFLRPAEEGIARFEVQGGGAPGGQRQPLALAGGDVTDVFAHDDGVLDVEMFDQELVAALDFVRRDGPHGTIFADVLLIGGGLALMDFIFLHARQGKKKRPLVPQNRSTHLAPKTCGLGNPRPTREAHDDSPKSPPDLSAYEYQPQKLRIRQALPNVC